MNVWLKASRPKTLPAAIVPVALATALAASDGVLAGIPALLCLLFAVLIQVGTNFANDYYDYLKGADGDDRVGPTRVVSAGLVSPGRMKRATMGVFLSAFLVGTLLIPYGGLWLLGIGVASIVCGYAYTGGPYPLGYNGLGEVFVFIFFGFIATGVTYYVQTGSFSVDAWLLGVIPGALASNLLVVNNVRDMETDAQVGKQTLAVRFGDPFGRWEYVCFWGLALSATLTLSVLRSSYGVLLPWILCMPLFWLSRRLFRLSFGGPERWGRLLAQTAQILVVYGVLQVIGLLI